MKITFVFDQVKIIKKLNVQLNFNFELVYFFILIYYCTGTRKLNIITQDTIFINNLFKDTNKNKDFQASSIIQSYQNSLYFNFEL